MKVLFIVQGEGRGHLFQALALKQMMDTGTYILVGVLVGTTKDRSFPEGFINDIKAPVTTFLSPALKYNTGAGKGVNMKQTLFLNLKQIPAFAKSLQTIHQTVNRLKPDVIINFYELLTGFYCFCYRPVIPVVSIGHQYLMNHPEFVFPEKQTFQKQLLRLNNRMTAFGSVRRLALSFRYMPDCPDRNLYVIPPLIREEVRAMEVSHGNYILVYLTHPSLQQQIIDWHVGNPDIMIHCFGSFSQEKPLIYYSDFLVFHQIDSTRYLQMMASCRALATTAGFESVSEAMLFNKPVLMVPVPGHYEQACNAIDGQVAGAGVAGKTFDLSLLINYIPRHSASHDVYERWLTTERRKILTLLFNVKGK